MTPKISMASFFSSKQGKSILPLIELKFVTLLKIDIKLLPVYLSIEIQCPLPAKLMSLITHDESWV